jgi:tetratricopeptide (TPR) repeat protein
MISAIDLGLKRKGLPLANPEIQQAIEAIEQGRIEEGRYLLETMVPDFLDDEDRSEWACWLAKALVMGKDPDSEGALDVITSAIKQNGEDGRLFVTKGIVLTEANRFEEAEQCFARAVCLLPNDWEAHLNRGIFREQIGKFRQAIHSFRAAASRAKENSGEPFVHLASLYRRLEKYEEAAEALKRYLEIEPMDSHEWVSLAVLESDLGNYKDANQAYQNALTYEPGNITALFNCAITCQREKETKLLEHYVHELMRWAPKDRRTYWARGIALVEQGKIEEAIKIFMLVFRQALNVEDLGVGELGALAAWMFPAMKQINATEDAKILLRQALESFLFEEGLLGAFVDSFGELSEKAIRFVLTVDAADPDDMPDENGIPRHWRYIRRYEITAESVDDAWTKAFKAEIIVGGEDIKRGDLLVEEKIEDTGRVGITFMSEGNAYLEE